MSNAMRDRETGGSREERSTKPTWLKIHRMHSQEFAPPIRFLLPIVLIIITTSTTSTSTSAGTGTGTDTTTNSASIHQLNGNGAHQFINRGAHSRRGPGSDRGSIVRTLPSGPPPFRPSSLVLGLNSFGALEKLKRTKLFRRMYKSKVYYLFLDVLQQLGQLLSKIAKKKIDVAGSSVAAIEAVAGKLLLKGGQQLKLKWPLVMLNPHFIKEILANPTFLVMLFHAIEVAYMSTPMAFWLKPLVKLVKQSSPEKEEEVWWRRKRLYEVLNGPGSSELEPSLKAAHFRSPGQPAPISLAGLVSVLRQMMGRPEGRPAYYRLPGAPDVLATASELFPAAAAAQEEEEEAPAMAFASPEAHQGPIRESAPMQAITYHDDVQQQGPHLSQSPSQHQYQYQQQQQQHQHHHGQAGSDGYLTSVQEESFLANQDGAWPLAISQATDRQQFMSASEFNLLGAREKELVLRETRKSHREAQLAEELIRQQSELVDSFAQRQDGTLLVPFGLMGEP